MKNLKWYDWLYIVFSVLTVSPFCFYMYGTMYGTMIFGDVFFNAEQKQISILMAVIWLAVSLYYRMEKDLRKIYE
ncbi:hypothetical protein LU293_04330 [Moraxella nasovis]|uniref:hypothetical protein n=1 Tax=Moraxella nasovis TaxID=2904121 RepID=UPI001F617D81|nr:hypothetical protein [Moraxella nasovis]UNU74130.1 hypothetical protein LU293_04330 [Moraxella nasovis]